MLVTDFPQHPQIAGVVEPHAAGALGDRLGYDSSKLVTVAACHLAHFRLPSRVNASAGWRPGSEQVVWQDACEEVGHTAYRVADRHCPEGVPVVAAGKCQEAVAFTAADISLVLDRGLQGHFDRDGSRIGEEDVFEPGGCH